MNSARRVYLYGTALAALVLFLISSTAVVRSVAATWMADPAQPPEQLFAGWNAFWPIVALGTLLAWIAHAMLANRAARPLTMAGAAERGSAPRKVYLYGGQLAAAGATVAQAALAVRLAARDFLNVPPEGDLAVWPGRTAALAAGGLLSLVVWVYLRWESDRDGDLGREPGSSASIRQIYVYILAATGMVLVLGGAAELLRTLLRVARQFLAPGVTWREPLADAMTALVIGVPLALLAWRRADRAAQAAPTAEMNALARVLVRSTGLVFGTLATLFSLTYLAALVIVLLFGGAIALRTPLDATQWPWALAYLPVGIAAWLTCANALRTDAALGRESRRTAAIRRLIRYGIAGLGLAMFWYGATQFARLILQVLLITQTGDAASASGWWSRFAEATALSLIGAPFWWGHWWSQQMRARQPDAQGQAERASAVRRLYLRGIVLVGACVTVAAAGFAAFLAVNWGTAQGEGRAAVAGAGAAAAVSLVWTVLHLLTLWGDRRWLAVEAAAAHAEGFAFDAPAPAPSLDGSPSVASPGVVRPPTESGWPIENRAAEPRHYRREDLPPLPAGANDGARPVQPERPARPTPSPERSLAVIDGGDGAVGAALLAALSKAQLPVALWPIGLNAAAQVTMLDALAADTPPAVPPDAVHRVAAVLGPADIMIPGALDGDVTAELAESLAASSARILLLPPRNPHLRWVAAPDWSLAEWVEHAVIEALNTLGQG